ncbi:hypothetical protein RZS08_11320, partial [Arthrospira platensis SPKY1]|nr:hypothetical protein [Arthrospira platensis SPKY1]
PAVPFDADEFERRPPLEGNEVLGEVKAASAPRRGWDDHADVAISAFDDLLQQPLHGDAVAEPKTKGEVGFAAIVNDCVSGCPWVEERQLQGVKRRQLLEHDGRKLAAQVGGDVGLGREVLDVCQAAGRQAAVVGGDELERAAAEDAAAHVDVFDGEPGAELDGVVGGAGAVEELGVEPHHDR